MDKVIYLFPDTNLFIQCRALGALDWSSWSKYSEVQLIVSRPVQREIDNQKNRGNDRVGRRARKAHQLFRHILLESDQDYFLVREAAPQVKLFLAGLGKPSSELMDVLDYTKADDELVGYMWEYRKQYENRDVCLLTHDTGPMMTAKTIDLPFIPIPENWLLPPEPNEAEREIQRLNERISQLQTGPKFEISFVDQYGNEMHEIKESLQIPLPLTSHEINALASSLGDRLPQNFGISVNFFDQSYQKWVDQCKVALASLHKEIQLEVRGITFSVLATNLGVRSARDVLVEISTKGGFLILPLRQIKEIKSDKWKVSLPNLRNYLRFGSTASERLMSLPRLNENYRRDANAFYYKPTRPDRPVTSYFLECEQWRHGLDGNCFENEMFIDHAIDEIHGMVECTIHADNLSTPVKKRMPVHIVVEGVNVVDRAKGLLADLES